MDPKSSIKAALFLPHSLIQQSASTERGFATGEKTKLAAVGVHLFLTFPHMCSQSYLVQLQKNASSSPLDKCVLKKKTVCLTLDNVTNLL